MGRDEAMKSTLNTLPVQSMNMLTVEELKQAWARSEPLEMGDPYLSLTEFDLHGTFYPLGFPVKISTNSSKVLEAADKSWRSFHKLFDLEPIRLMIGVTDGGSRECPPAPIPRMRELLLSCIADADNYAVSDYSRAFSFMWVTSATLEHRDYFRYFFLNSTVMGQLVHRYAWGIHAACVELDGSGLLFCGDSGAGKSTLSYACARAGWTYITDDGSYLVDGRDDRLIVGDCSMVRFRPSSESLFPELSGRPVMQRAEIGKPSIEFATSSVPRFNTSSMSQIKHVVFLNRNVDRQELVPFPVEVAKLYMLQRASAEPQLRKRQARMFDRLLEGGVFELRYTDLDWAQEKLRQLIREEN
jgi:hypothetical protein